MHDLPKYMVAIEAEKPGNASVLKANQRLVPKPRQGEVLIKVAAAGVNRPDVMQRMGLYPPPPGAPSILGLEIAGVVAAVGEGVDPSLLGQPLCALVAGGGYAQYCVAPLEQCLPVPPALTISEAAAIPETLFTVWANLFYQRQVAAGTILLVHGGTSGIGTMAILLGKLFGFEVIVTAGSAEKCQRALEIGAAYAIDYNGQDFVAEIKRITAGRGVDVVLDMVGGDYVARNLACLAEEGRHISIAGQRGMTAEIPIWTIMAKRLILTGSTLRARSAEFKSALAADIRARLWSYVEAGRLKPVIDSIFPLEAAADAHRRMESGAYIGKIVLEVG